jgi:hypothetical protein
MQEVLNTLERHTVCTGTQCFESEEDAFGITTTPNGSPSNSTNFFMFMMCAAPSPPPPPRPDHAKGGIAELCKPQREARGASLFPRAPGERAPYCYGLPPPSLTSTARHYIAPRTPVSPIGQHAG